MRSFAKYAKFREIKPSRKFPNLLYLLDSFLLINIYFTSEYSVSDEQEHDMVGKETKWDSSRSYKSSNHWTNPIIELVDKHAAKRCWNV